MPQAVIFCVEGLLNKPCAEDVSHLADLAAALTELGEPPLIPPADWPPVLLVGQSTSREALTAFWTLVDINQNFMGAFFSFLPQRTCSRRRG